MVYSLRNAAAVAALASAHLVSAAPQYIPRNTEITAAYDPTSTRLFHECLRGCSDSQMANACEKDCQRRQLNTEIPVPKRQPASHNDVDDDNDDDSVRVFARSSPVGIISDVKDALTASALLGKFTSEAIALNSCFSKCNGEPLCLITCAVTPSSSFLAEQTQGAVSADDVVKTVAALGLCSESCNGDVSCLASCAVTHGLEALEANSTTAKRDQATSPAMEFLKKFLPFSHLPAGLTFNDTHLLDDLPLDDILDDSMTYASQSAVTNCSQPCLVMPDGKDKDMCLQPCFASITDTFREFLSPVRKVLKGHNGPKNPKRDQGDSLLIDTAVADKLREVWSSVPEVAKPDLANDNKIDADKFAKLLALLSKLASNNDLSSVVLNNPTLSRDLALVLSKITEQPNLLRAILPAYVLPPADVGKLLTDLTGLSPPA
ncbi:hypothetical protein SUNI508_13370 [Seiridium unicorne]|uniref:Uncharacterized protein n=1 Tax=Seiridium unicorne TaxID=138068 RepID=A0ABR2VDF1_9PEZI